MSPFPILLVIVLLKVFTWISEKCPVIAVEKGDEKV
jgi:hypothetical protein